MAIDRVASFMYVLLASALLEGCEEPLHCSSTAVVERLSVKLDREMRENPRFLAPHEPDRSRFAVSAVRQEGLADGALACTAAFVGTLDATPAYAARHGFTTPDRPSVIERLVHFTAHRGRWDTYVEVVSLDAARSTSAAATTKVFLP